MARASAAATKPRAHSTPGGPGGGSHPWLARQIIQRLHPLYGPAQAPRSYDSLSELLYTILSQHTSDANSTRAYANLRASFPSWEAVAAALVEQVAETIRVGGLAQIKARRIQTVLRQVKEQAGGYDLSFLGEMPLAEAKGWLRGLSGVGPKTVACVLLFALGRPALPVDTHVHRVAKRLGLFDGKVTAERAHELLESMLKPREYLPFHMYVIIHGRRVCKAQRPLCGQCALERRCPSSILRPRRGAAS